VSSGDPLPASRRVPIVERPVLFGLLDGGLDTRVTVVIAPAGSGKTFLVRSWLDARNPAGQGAWVSVERGERDPQRFWSALVNEVSRAAVPGARVAEITPAPGFNAEGVIARFLADLASLRAGLVIVIDDLHEIKSEEILGQLGYFLDHVSSRVHVVLVSRHDPQLGLHRRRLEGDLTEVRADRLRFTIGESRELLAAAGVTLSEDGLTLLHGRTEGWVAGLRLAALSIVAHPDPERFVAEFSGSERTVAEYLIAEVLDSLSPDIRKLLLRTSILDRVNGGLGDLLTGDSGTERHLSALAETAGFVIPLDAKGEWFRYHHLFADLLAAELRHAEAEAVPGLHLAAARWHADHGHVLEAVGHALAAGDPDLVASLLVEHYFSLMLDGRQATARALVDSAARRWARPELAVVLAADELIEGSLDRAAAQLALAARQAGEVPADRRQRFEMMLYITRLSLARRVGDFQSVLEATQPAVPFPEPRNIADISLQTDVRALMLMNLGIVEVWSGRREDGERHLIAAGDIARQIGRPYLQASCQAHRAQAISWRSFSQARPVAEEAMAIASRHGLQDDPVAGAALVVLGSCMVASGQLAGAAEAFRLADAALRPDLEPAIGFVLQTGHGVINLVNANYPEAIESFLEAERLGKSLVTSSPLALQARCAMLYAAVLGGDNIVARAALEELTEAERSTGEVREVIAARLLAEGDAHAALAALEPTVAERTKAHHGLVLIRSLLLDAKARYMINDDAAARSAVERALDLAETEELILPFLWVGSSELLERHHRHQTAHGAFLNVLRDALSGRGLADDRRHAGSSFADLSETELRVLRYLPTNLTAAGIASEISVSVNTVKTHMRSIYMKLDAHSRTQAVEYARDLGLLGRTAR
jgi:LuxR family maltose regulon positive regulatory protein